MIDYDLFEILPDQTSQWKGSVRGTRHALDQLEVLGKQTLNECIATAALTHEVLGRVNQMTAPRHDQTNWTKRLNT
jgi:hypothetical protein